MAPITPKAKKVADLKSPSTSSQKKMKQSSLMSFFSKQSPTTSKIKPVAAEGKKVGVNPKKGTALFVGQEDDDDDEDADNLRVKKDNIGNSSLDFGSKKTYGKEVEKAENVRSFVKPETSSQDDDKSLSLLIKTTPATEMDDTFGESDDSLSLSSTRRKVKRNISYAESSSDDDDDLIASSKRRRKNNSRADDEDEDDDDFIPAKKVDIESEESEDDDKIAINDIDLDDDDDLLELASKPKSQTTKSVNKILNSSVPSKPSTPRPVKKINNSSKHSNFNKENEERYQWLVDIRDAQKRPISDPEYDPRTLYIPSSAWNKFTAFEKQYWEIKSKMWDCVVFFKKGKFFELYEKDAMLGNSLFDLKIAGGGRANMQLAGIPEMSFDYWSSQFIQYGYKVAKVDQRESMLAKEMREGSKGIVKRELECVLTSGTLTDGSMLHSDLATYCMAIREEPGNYYTCNDENIVSIEETMSKKIFGVAFIDTATGELQMLEFEDDKECSKFDTLMSQIKPKEVIMEKNNLSNLAQKIVKFNSSPQAIFNYMKPGTEFYDFHRTYDELLKPENAYFEEQSEWPTILQKYYNNGKQVGFSAFGGLLNYLKWLKLDSSLISLGNMKEYNLIKSQHSMILDGVTLQNLEIFSNTFDGSDKGTLFKLFNRAITPMGKRTMRTWVMHPLLHKADIDKRLDSVEQLLDDPVLRDLFESHLSKIPDLERLLSRIHAGTVKMKDFDKVIQGFETIVKLLTKISNQNFNGALGVFVSQIPESLFQDVAKWTNAFDREKAIVEDVMEPHSGVEPEFDESLDKIKGIEEDLNDHLRRYKKEFKCSTIHFKDSGKEIYTIEVPMAATKLIPSSWMQMGANKSSKRYYSEEVSKLARSMAEARESHKIIEQDLKNRLSKKFHSHYKTSWMPTIEAISKIDCLIALARTSESLGAPSCRPQLVDEIDPATGAKLNGYLKFKSLRHPCFNLGSTSIKEFIPNDIELGKDVPQLGLLTGANAAGKSTILRMTCVAVIMAQIGCYVPCESATMTPVDKIMTRLGANDNIMQGKSTFLVELSETKKILDVATNRSLLVLDELGRGGSSNDGFAIAESVLYHVATHMQSLGFFATHYGSLGLSFKGHPQVRPLKMSILVDEGTRNITFLYKLVEGQSEGSFGMHVASMCGIPKKIVDNAQVAAETYEHTSILRRARKASDQGRGDNDENGIPIGLSSDFVRLVYGSGLANDKKGTGEGVMIYDDNVKTNVLQTWLKLIDSL
ncbi:hypothetical protein Kpol_1075p4 [Vanderwaltozyma polyspora DSM 70294]|uniref:DNA mismatch repair protein n=1 Tax=Vanderwaltozyma polyspora (strain ATCC 22028 / DSM 70294 / BCRC 21397 / CBS 2163 / NBRC 10782 / NRRL Y-8283 / UCD 57-17) TaxID=436907 RepID=A7TSN2_VANPO|nr:uncharacterized protein Kpol_1075p4 [Vanderwaltozyma polyspora DSM 70294]EDO14726.1 hypothetical protein Kpol_1075p4 [Vanderwaltozyma polyspora DSM 70294]